MSDRFGDAQTSRSNPSVDYRAAVAGDIGDSVTLSPAAKAIEIDNNHTSAIKVKVGNTKGNDTTIIVQPGASRMFAGAVSRIYSTGSDASLASLVTAGTVAITLHLE